MYIFKKCNHCGNIIDHKYKCDICGKIMKIAYLTIEYTKLNSKIIHICSKKCEKKWRK